MSKGRRPLLAVVTAIVAFALVGVGVALATSGTFGAGSHSLVWDGQGSTSGAPNTTQCSGDTPNPGGMLFILTTDGASGQSVNSVTGVSNGTLGTITQQGNEFHIPITGVTNLSALINSLKVTFTYAGTPQNGSQTVFTLSHGCPGTTPPAADLTVSKNANGTYDDTYSWKIEKSANPTEVFTAGGATGSSDYTVTVSHGDSQDSNWAVSGTITVKNPNGGNVSGVNVTDLIDNGGSCTVSGGTNATIPANGHSDFGYSCSYSSAPSSLTGVTNTATATWPAQDLSNGSHLNANNKSYPVTFDFVANEIDSCAAVSDTVAGSLGTVCAGVDANPKVISYSGHVNGPAGHCTDNSNTASFTTNTTGATGDASATVKDCQGANLTVTKTASGSYDRECDWTISKSVDFAKQTVDAGKPATFNYNVHVGATCNRIENVQASGTITVSNPNVWEAVTLNSLTDVPDNGGTCTVDTSPGLTIPAGGSVTYSYNCTYPNSVPSAGLNTATATWNSAAYHTPNGSMSGSAGLAFTETLTDNCVDVTDTLNGGLGHFCNFSDAGGSHDFPYSLTFYGPAPGTCGVNHNNTASFTDNSSPQRTGDSNTVTVQVCSYRARLTLGYWKNHLAKNGTPGCTGLPNGTGCSKNGPWTKTYLPQFLGGYSVTTIQMAANVFKANNCRNGIACLAAQLLAAELNVANGANICINATIASANVFLISKAYNGPGTYTLTTAQRATAVSLASTLDTYNNGGGC